MICEKCGKILIEKYRPIYRFNNINENKFLRLNNNRFLDSLKCNYCHYKIKMDYSEKGIKFIYM